MMERRIAQRDFLQAAILNMNRHYVPNPTPLQNRRDRIDWQSRKK
jgi:hypothetical protein